MRRPRSSSSSGGSSAWKYEPRRLVTDGLPRHGVARREILPEVRHRTSRYLNNRAESWHRPTRRRERYLQRFMSPEQAQRFLSSHAMINGHFRARRHLMAATRYRRPPGVAAEDVRSDGSLRARTTAQPASARSLAQQLGNAVTNHERTTAYAARGSGPSCLRPFDPHYAGEAAGLPFSTVRVPVIFVTVGPFLALWRTPCGT
ncbi:DDE-type integrase/transposase/recombinase [Dankookia sp. P2]|uniref:DDE-type integrase/transposase/recombinase n=1 Tax=Dankookia sp. P2 TaxID=3423955 RepID=UPI003D67E7C8